MRIDTLQSRSNKTPDHLRQTALPGLREVYAVHGRRGCRKDLSEEPTWNEDDAVASRDGTLFQAISIVEREERKLEHHHHPAPAADVLHQRFQIAAELLRIGIGDDIIPPDLQKHQPV